MQISPIDVIAAEVAPPPPQQQTNSQILPSNTQLNNINNNHINKTNSNVNVEGINNTNNIALSNNNNTTTNVNATTSTPVSNNNSGEVKVKRKRRRIPLSCTICRKRKIKCDKTRPRCEQCTKSGVGHLCHYMEQSWAEQAVKDLSKDMELKQLRERVKYLERTLNKLHGNPSSTFDGTPYGRSPANSIGQSPHADSMVDNNSNSNTSSNFNDSSQHVTSTSNDTIDFNKDSSMNNNNMSRSGELILNQRDKYDNDELDLTKQFDMLHIKNNGTIHLGATHWLAIMKGDPYLKLLWGHIFNIREKVNGWYSQRMKLNKNIQHKRPLKQTTKHLMDNNSSIGKNILDNTQTNSNIIPHPLNLTADNSIKRCPVTGQSSEDFAKISANTSNTIVKSEGEPNENVPLTNSNDLENIVIKTETCPDILPFNKEQPMRCPVTGAISAASPLASHPFVPTPPAAYASKQDTRKRPIPYNINPAVNHVTRATLPPINKIHPTNFKRLDYGSMTRKEILQRVAKLLPPRHIIFQFVNKFFRHIYPIIPIIDEKNFKNHLEEILSSRVDALAVDPSPLKIRVSKPSDYCHLGIMVLILRLTWLSLPANRCELKLGAFESNSVSNPASPASISSTSSSPSANVKEDNMLINFETPVECLELVKDYLIKFDKISSLSNNNINLTTIQFAIFYKMYMSNSPTEGFVVPKKNAINSISDSNAHDNESNQILMSSIVQMAFSCGLHRDPDNFPQLNVVSTYHNKESGTTLKEATTEASSNENNDSDIKNKENQIATERFKHTWRKIWYYIVHLDVEQSLAIGSPRLLRNMKEFSDTKLPSSSKIDYVRDIKELIIIKNFTLFWQIDLIIIAVLNHVLNVFLAKNVRKYELDALIESLKDLTYGKKNIRDIINDLINKNLLYTSEASVSFEDHVDDSYGLPSLEDILLREAVSTPNSTANTPAPSTHDAVRTSNNNSTSNNNNTGEKRFELPHESTTKALFFTKHLMLRMVLYLLNYILFTHYEPLGSQDSGTIALTKRYAQETLNFALDGYRNCLIFFNNVRKTSHAYSTIFDYSNVLLSPGCLDIGHRSLQFLVCLTLRAKCGPIGGINQNLFTSSGSEESEGDSNTEDIPQSKAIVKNLSEINPNVINDINLDSVTDLQLSENLIARMKLFEDLTKQVAVKYPYASRTSRSTGFFITLLGGNSSTKTNRPNTTRWKHPNISNFFKNVPSMVLSGENDQLSRCPVFQDALGFVSPKLSGTSDSTKLPPIKSTYKPITYTNSNIRKVESNKEHPDEKRRKLNPFEVDNGKGSTDSVDLHDSNKVPESASSGIIMSNSGVNIIPPLPIMNSINNLIGTIATPNEFGDPTNYTNIKGTSNNDDIVNQKNVGVTNRQSARDTNFVKTNGSSNGNSKGQQQTQQFIPMSQGQGSMGSTSSTPVNIPLAPSKLAGNIIDQSDSITNMMIAGNGYPEITNMELLNEVVGNDSNTNMNELFNPSNVIQAITQFNPLFGMNDMNNPYSVNGVDSKRNHGTPDTAGDMDVSGRNNPVSPYRGSIESNSSNTNYKHSIPTTDNLYPSINSNVTNININSGNNVNSINSQSSMIPGINMIGSNGNSPSVGSQGQVEMDFFMPRIEDGFTDLQDFTIWD